MKIHITQDLGSFDMVSDNNNFKNCIKFNSTVRRNNEGEATTNTSYQLPVFTFPTSTQRQMRAKTPFDYSKFESYQLNEVNRLRIETRLRQLNDQVNIKPKQWHKKFNINKTKNKNYDFTRVMDHMLA
jgi:hypothetical protein